MRGGKTATYIAEEMRREKYWKSKAIRQRCYQDGIKQCDKCMYSNICDDKEVIDEV